MNITCYTKKKTLYTHTFVQVKLPKTRLKYQTKYKNYEALNLFIFKIENEIISFIKENVIEINTYLSKWCIFSRKIDNFF